MCTIICIGDSITEGVGSSSVENCYVSALQVFLGKNDRVCNFGRNAATLMAPPNGNQDQYKCQPHFTRALKEAKRATEAGDAVIVSVMLGTNDADICDYGFPPTAEAFCSQLHDRFISEYLELIDAFLAVAPAARFILCKSPYSYDPVKHKNFGNLESVWAFQSEIIEICKKRGMKVVVNDMARATSPETIGQAGVARYFFDALHPNDVGHMYFAHFFYEAVRRAEQQ